MIFLDLPARKIWYTLKVRSSAQCHLCAITPRLVTKSIHQQPRHRNASNVPPSSIYAAINSVATPPNYQVPDTAQPMIAHPSIVHPSIALSTMACTKIVQPGAASDDATFNFTTFDSTTFDGTTYNDTDYHGSAYHGAA